MGRNADTFASNLQVGEVSAGTPLRRTSGDGEIDPDILEACRRGDRDAFRVLYETYKDRVYSIAFYFFNADRDAAAEVTQQVFLKLIRDVVRFRGDSAFSTWLYRLVVNACVDRSRKRRGHVVGLDPEILDTVPSAAPSREDAVVTEEVAASVQRAIAALPRKLRAAILLRYFEDLSYADIAAALNCSIGTVASRLSRGHRLLAKKLTFVRAGLPGNDV